MSIREVYDNPGQFTVTLKPDTPPDILSAITELDHLVLHAQGDQVFGPEGYTDATLLSEARYAGPILEIEFEDQPFTIRGQGMQWHLGDSNGHGPIFAEVREFTTATASTVFDDFTDGGIIPASLTQGTITNPASLTYSGTFYPADLSIEAFRTVAKTLSMHYRINPDGTVDASPDTDNNVYKTNESGGVKLAVAVRNFSGSDPERVGIEALRTRVRRDATNWVSRVAIVDEAYDGTNTIATFKDRASNPYYDIRNNALIRNHLASRPASDALTTDEYLTTELENWNLEEGIDIDLNQWEISDGDIAVGDFIWVYDPQAGITDSTNEVFYRGQWIYPKKIRVLEGDWPLTEGMGVFVRPGGSSVAASDWIDLSSYVAYENRP